MAELRRLATQRICPSCGNRHYPQLVPEISAGQKGCEFCTREPQAMSVQEYADAMRALQGSTTHDCQQGNGRPEPGE